MLEDGKRCRRRCAACGASWSAGKPRGFPSACPYSGLVIGLCRLPYRCEFHRRLDHLGGPRTLSLGRSKAFVLEALEGCGSLPLIPAPSHIPFRESGENPATKGVGDFCFCAVHVQLSPSSMFRRGRVCVRARVWELVGRNVHCRGGHKTVSSLVRDSS